MLDYSPIADDLLDRIMRRESGGRSDARGAAGEIGLMQIMPATAAKYGVSPDLLKNPIVNRYVAKRYLGELLKEFGGDTSKAVAAYNAGPRRVKEGKVPKSTIAYVKDVLGSGVGTIRSGYTGPPSLNELTGVGHIRSGYSPDLSGPDRSTLEIPSRFGEDHTRATLEIPSRPQGQPSFNMMTTQGRQGTTASDVINRILGAMGPTPAYGEELPPASMIPEGKFQDFSNGKTYTNVKGKVIEVPKPKDSAMVRAAGWLPTIGQFGGEALGGLGGATIPGAGETGVSEYAGAVAGGAGGSALGTEAENAIRKAYGLPPVSVKQEALYGGAGTAIGRPLAHGLPFLGRFLRATKIGQAAGMGFDAAVSKARGVESDLASRFGLGAKAAETLKTEPASGVRKAYEAAKAVGNRELGQEYDAVLGQYQLNPITTNAGQQALNGSPGHILEMVGKPFRTAIEDEFAKQPKTVRGVQQLLTFVRQRARMLNPDTDKAALVALGDIEKGLEYDRDQVIGQQAASKIKEIDYRYARQQQRFPMNTVRRAMTMPQATEDILASKPGDVGRVMEVIDEMKRTGNIGELQKGLAARIFQKAEVGQAVSPAARLKGIEKAVNSVPGDIFDGVYGKGAQKAWLATARELSEHEQDLLTHPAKAKAIAVEVEKYLQKPSVLADLMGHYARHRAVFEGLALLGGYASGNTAEAIGAVAGLELYEAVAHSRPAMAMLRLAAHQKAPAAARLIVAALNAGMRAGAESVADTVGVPNAP